MTTSRMSSFDSDVQNVSRLERELYFLIVKFLENGPCRSAAEVLKNGLTENQLLPLRFDWEGQEHFRSYQKLIAAHRHVGPDHLLKICQRIGPLLDKEVAPCVKGVASLLGAGRQSLLRTKDGVSHVRWSGSTHMVCQHGKVLMPPVNLAHQPNVVKILQCAQYSGCVRRQHAFPEKSYSRCTQIHRTLGHLSAVYCVIFDRSGKYVITGADDHLVKIWSATTGRLLATLRGHAAEITDIAVNYENTLLAAGSCDKTVRVWCLKSTAPVAILQAHTSMITGLQFCPFVRGNIRYLMSIGGDGCVCYWEFNVILKTFSPKPIKFIERSRAGAQMLCASFSPGGIFLATGNSDHVIRVYCFTTGIPEKISELEAHSDIVDSIQYSNSSQYFVSGSKDGSARIWRFERQEWRCIVLNMANKLPSQMTTEQEEAKANKHRVTMVGWTHDDQYVLTAVSDFSIKIWDRHGGKLVHVLQGHEDEIFMLESVQADASVIVSAGHDGRVMLWNVNSGTLIKSFYNNIEGQGHGAVFDLKVSPDGLMIAATDSHGYLMLYGFGSNDKFSLCPTEQFFHTDYRPLMRDSNNYVLDEQTQKAPHLMPPPFLVDMDGNPHPPQMQRLVPGREHLKKNQLIPQMGVTPSGDREVLDQAVGDGPAPAVGGQQADQPVGQPASQPAFPGQPGPDGDGAHIIDHFIARMQQEQDARIAEQGGEPLRSPNREDPLSPTAAGPSRRRSTTEGVRQNSLTQSASSVVRPVWCKRTCVPSLDKSLLETNETWRKAMADEEINKFVVERKRKPILISEGESSDAATVHARRKKNKNRLRVAENEETGRNRLTTRALYDTDIEEEEETAEDTEIDPGQASDHMWGSSDTSDNESSDYSDWREDAGMNLQPPKRSQRKRKKRMHISEEEEQDKSEDEDSGPSEPKTKIQSSTKTKKKKKQMQRKQVRKKVLEADDRVVKELPEEFKLPDWLTETFPRKAPYFPQMGDEVMYFRQGHELYVNAVAARNVYKIDPTKNQPWHRLPNLREMELVKVFGIKYIAKPPRLVTLKLAFIDPDGKQTGGTFIVKYHDMPDVIDFIVLKQNFDAAMRFDWKTNDRFRCIIDDKWWGGTIEAHEPLHPEFADSWFQCFLVLWDNGERERLSPWDFEPLKCKSKKGKQHTEGIPIQPGELVMFKYSPKEGDWPECGIDEECDRIVHGMEEIMQLSVAESFLAPVDLNAYPDYAIVIDYPIDLSTIKARLENKFYRRVAALKYDVRYIEQNATEYNEPSSMIVKHARLVTEVLLQFINHTSYRDPRVIYMELSQEGEFAIHGHSDTESGSDSDRSGKGTKKRKNEVRRLSVKLPDINAWKANCAQLLTTMIQSDDSTPFRNPVSPDDYPDYYQIIDHPMNISIVKEQLDNGTYESPPDFAKDVKLMFTNSKRYNTNKRSRIYAMTLNLSAMFEEQMKDILLEYKSAIKYEKTGKLTNKKTSSIKRSPSSSNSTVTSQPAQPANSKTNTSSAVTLRAGTSISSSQRTINTASRHGPERSNLKRSRRLHLEEDVEEENGVNDSEDHNSGTSTDSSDGASEYERKNKPNIRRPPARMSRHKHTVTNGHSIYSTRCATGSIKRRRYDISDDENENVKHKTKHKIRRKADTPESSDSENTDSSLAPKKPKAKFRRKVESIESNDESGSATSGSNSGSSSNSGSDSGSSAAESDAESHLGEVSTSSNHSGCENSSRSSHPVADQRASTTRRTSSRQPKHKENQKSTYFQRDSCRNGGAFDNSNRQTRNQGRRTVRYQEDSDAAGSDNNVDNEDTPTLNVTSSGRIVRPTARVRNTYDCD